MSIFEQVFGCQGSLVCLSHVNGMSSIHEKDGILTFTLTPTHKADSVLIKQRDVNTVDITLIKRQMPYQYFQGIDYRDVVGVLEKSTDLLF